MTKPNRYTPEQIEFLREGYQSMNTRDLTKAFNAKYGASKTETAIKSALANRKITCGRAHKDRLVTLRRLCTPEQDQFIKNNYIKLSQRELTTMLNAKFNTGFTVGQIKTYVKNHKIRSGRTGCFEKGNTPWNHGTKGQGLTGPNSGSFKKGNVPANRKPLWSERVCSKDGFVLMKVPEVDPYTGFPTRYKHKHVYIWEQENGPVPEGVVVAFKGGDKTNCEPENLMLISRAELLRLNKHGYKDAPDELKPSILALAKLEVKAFEKGHSKNI